MDVAAGEGCEPNAVLDVMSLGADSLARVVERSLSRLDIGGSAEIRTTRSAGQPVAQVLVDKGLVQVLCDRSDVDDTYVVVLAKVSPLGKADWLPAGFVVPTLPNPAADFHVRPFRQSDAEMYQLSVAGSYRRLSQVFAETQDWPSVDLTVESCRRWVGRLLRQMEANESFTFAVFNIDQTVLLGGLHICPPFRAGGVGAEICWWFVDRASDSHLESGLVGFISQWVYTDWPIQRPRFIGRDIDWPDWSDLPAL